ncbi:MAG: HD domain-containing protein [Alphaproteobacteria bacterium]|nr:HD domain-containing protein [Alphaproteobacteria bacterium]
MPTITTGDMLFSVGLAMDQMTPDLVRHHTTTAMLTDLMAETAGIFGVRRRRLVKAAMIHDMGTLVGRERVDSTFDHAAVGAAMVSTCAPLADLSNLIRHHHAPHQIDPDAPDAFDIGLLSIADFVADRLRPDVPILLQSRDVLDLLQTSADPADRVRCRAIDCCLEASRSEAFWLSLDLRIATRRLRESLHSEPILDRDGVLSLMHLIGLAIDSKSSFTASHSAGVAVVARALGYLCGLPDNACWRLEAAGYLHDIGKLGVSNDILEKPGRLDDLEVKMIRGHSFMSWAILSEVPDMSDIALWAGLHHERLDGKGYPFQRRGDDIPLEARILTIADRFTALVETRPYRHGLETTEALSMLRTAASDGEIDGDVVRELGYYVEDIDRRRELAQAEERWFGRAAREAGNREGMH